MENKDQNVNDEAKRLIIEKEQLESRVSPLGKVASYDVNNNQNTTIIEDIGWIKVNLESLPSQGAFYPVGTDITIRAASAAEIRHWSTIDENDLLGIDDALNRIVDRCCKVKFPKTMGSFKDLKEIDRFFIIFAIREYTFKKGENALNVTFSCKGCGKNETKSIIKEMISYYVPSEELQIRFSEDERCFHLKLTNGEEIKLYLPTLGVMAFIKGYIREKTQNKVEYDSAFLKWAPFLFPDWRILNESTYTKKLQDSFVWSLDMISVIDWFVNEMQKTVKDADLKNQCSGCGTEVVAPLSFRGGIKSLFLISDISSKLL